MGSTRELLDRFGLQPKKSWGQNFLVDGHAKSRIVQAAHAGPDDTVVEIGAGLGALTMGLAERAGRVIALDRDPDMIRVLEHLFVETQKVTVSFISALDFDFRAAAREAGRPLRVVGNLPYQITTPILFHVLAQAGGGAVVNHAVFMVQKEVADRLAAPPGSKVYGRLSVMVQQLAEVKALFRVPPHAFVPQPQVTSTVFSLAPRAVPWVAVHDDALFAAVVRQAFSTRRKMLRRALEAFGTERLTASFVASAIEPTRRAETLSVAEFGALTNALWERGARAHDAPHAETLDDADA